MSVSYGMPSPPQACGTRYVVALRLCFTKIDINLRKRDIRHVKKSKTHNITVSHTLFTVTMDKITIQSRRFYRPVKAFRHQGKANSGNGERRAVLEETRRSQQSPHRNGNGIIATHTKKKSRQAPCYDFYYYICTTNRTAANGGTNNPSS